MGGSLLEANTDKSRISRFRHWLGGSPGRLTQGDNRGECTTRKTKNAEAAQRKYSCPTEWQWFRKHLHVEIFISALSNCFDRQNDKPLESVIDCGWKSQPTLISRRPPRRVLRVLSKVPISARCIPWNLCYSQPSLRTGSSPCPLRPLNEFSQQHIHVHEHASIDSSLVSRTTFIASCCGAIHLWITAVVPHWSNSIGLRVIVNARSPNAVRGF